MLGFWSYARFWMQHPAEGGRGRGVRSKEWAGGHAVGQKQWCERLEQGCRGRAGTDSTKRRPPSTPPPRVVSLAPCVCVCACVCVCVCPWWH